MFYIDEINTEDDSYAPTVTVYFSDADGENAQEMEFNIAFNEDGDMEYLDDIDVDWSVANQIENLYQRLSDFLLAYCDAKADADDLERQLSDYESRF